MTLRGNASTGPGRKQACWLLDNRRMSASFFLSAKRLNKNHQLKPINAVQCTGRDGQTSTILVVLSQRRQLGRHTLKRVVIGHESMMVGVHRVVIITVILEKLLARGSFAICQHRERVFAEYVVFQEMASTIRCACFLTAQSHKKQ
jgi:hypothetical protein